MSITLCKTSYRCGHSAAKSVASVGFVIISFAGAAWAQSPSGPANAEPNGRPASGPPQAMTTNGTSVPVYGPPIGKLSLADVTFLLQAAENGHAELESSRLAAEKSTDPAIKAFAQHMVEDHGKANVELQRIAVAKGIELPDSPSLMQKAKLLVLDAMSGAAFDRRYSQVIGINAHQDALALFSKAAVNAKDPDVRDFATRTLTTLQRHLDMARQLPAVTPP